MEMKLNAQLIKTLRLKQSWSQEMLAEKAGLNPRTVQRVESEGSGSLRTRHSLATALNVEAEMLDSTTVDNEQVISGQTGNATILQKFQGYLASRDSYGFILLIFLTLFFAASRPFYFSHSRVNFSWINYSLSSRPMVTIPLWWLYTLLFWGLFALPWLAVVAKKCPQFLVWHISAMGLVLLLSIARLWQPALVMETVTFCLYYSSMGLLLALFVTTIDSTKIRHVVLSILGCYLFLWFFQALSHYFLVGTFAFLNIGLEFPPLGYTGKVILRSFGNLTQLIPVCLVLLYSMHHDSKTNGTSASALPATGKDTDRLAGQENTISPSSMSTLMAAPGG